MSDAPLVRLVGARVGFRGPGGRKLVAVQGADLEIGAGDSLGIVGESGSGKSTLLRALLRLVPLAAGEVHWSGRRVDRLGARALRPLRRDLQVVFQDPLASLDPRMTVREIVAEPLRVHAPRLDAAARADAVAAILERVGMPSDAALRHPHEFSGGQCQRIGIARAMVLRPRVLVCDEPVSALDVSVQAQVLQLLRELRREYGMALLFVSHNLAVVRELCSRVMVMQAGAVVETGPAERLLADPAHAYTRALLAAVPIPDPRAQAPRLAALAAAPPPITR